MEKLIKFMKEFPRTLIILAREDRVSQAEEDYECFARGAASGGSPVRVYLERPKENTPESPELRDSIANLLVGLRHRKGNVVVWIKPPEGQKEDRR